MIIFMTDEKIMIVNFIKTFRMTFRNFLNILTFLIPLNLLSIIPNLGRTGVQLYAGTG